MVRGECRRAVVGDDARRAQGVQRRLAGEAVRRRLDLRHLAQGVRRQGSLHHGGCGACRGVRPCESTVARRFLRRHARRPHHLAVGHRGAEEGVPAQDPQRHDALVPRLQRAQQRQRPGLAEDHGGARRRRVGHQRPEGVDHRRAPRRLLLPAHPHRPRRAEAQGHQLPVGAHAPRGRGGARHHPTRRHRRVLRGVLHRGPLPEGQRGRRRQQRVEGGQQHARVRARHERHHRLPALRGRVQADARRRHRQRRRARAAHPPATDGVLHQDPTAAHQRPAFAVGNLGRVEGPRRGGARCHQQDVLDRDAQGRDGAGSRHQGTPVPPAVLGRARRATRVARATR